MPFIPLRTQRKAYLGGVQQTGMFLGGAKVWAKPASLPWSFLSNIASTALYNITERTASRLVFNRNGAGRSHIAFDWNMPIGTRVRFRFGGAEGAAALWCRISPDDTVTGASQNIFNQNYNTTEVDFTVSILRPYFGFITGNGESSLYTNYTITNLIVTLP